MVRDFHVGLIAGPLTSLLVLMPFVGVVIEPLVGLRLGSIYGGTVVEPLGGIVVEPLVADGINGAALCERFCVDPQEDGSFIVELPEDIG